MECALHSGEYVCFHVELCPNLQHSKNTEHAIVYYTLSCMSELSGRHPPRALA